MTQGLEKFLGLPSLEDALRDQGVLPPADDVPAIAPVALAAPVSDPALGDQHAVDHADSMDEIHRQMMRHGSDLMELGFNIDHARARGIFEVAATFFKNAIDAKNSKRDAQLKAMKLALDARRLDHDIKRTKGDDDLTITGKPTVIVEDRNELIRRVLEERKKRGDEGS